MVNAYSIKWAGDNILVQWDSIIHQKHILKDYIHVFTAPSLGKTVTSSDCQILLRIRLVPFF